MFDIAVTLKYGHGHWKWYEQAKLSESIMQSLTFITFTVSKKLPMLEFSTNRDTWQTKNMLIISLNTHQNLTNHIAHDLLMYAAIIQGLNYSRQESKMLNLQFIFLTYLCL